MTKEEKKAIMEKVEQLSQKRIDNIDADSRIGVVATKKVFDKEEHIYVDVFTIDYFLFPKETKMKIVENISMAQSINMKSPFNILVPPKNVQTKK